MTTSTRIAEGPFQLSWDSLSQHQIPRWYQDAKFGIFIHWGVYSAADMAPIKAAITEIIDTEARRLCSEGALTDPCADEPFEQRLAALYAQNEEAGLQVHRAVTGYGGGGYDDPAMLQMLRHEPLLGCMESLLGPDLISSSVYRIRPKMPHLPHGEVPWHQDSGYLLPHCDRYLIVTCWVPLVDSTLTNGCLYVQPRAHKTGIYRHYTGGHANFLEIALEDRAPVEPIAVEMRAGDALLLTNMTLQRTSFENTTNDVRWCVDLRYQNMEPPNDIDEDPATYTPERDSVTMACHPPEADFVIRDTHNPAREVVDPVTFRAIRQRFADNRPHSPGRGWAPWAER
ncbi:MAG: phytanoyl-CoA hydroxylase [Planctomycetota bacterium]|jgi:phytanoyl-CoA hydroxylase